MRVILIYFEPIFLFLGDLSYNTQSARAQAVDTVEEFAEAIAEKFEMLNGKPVGGELVHVSKIGLVAPYTILALTLAAGVLGSVKKNRAL